MLLVIGLLPIMGSRDLRFVVIDDNEGTCVVKFIDILHRTVIVDCYNGDSKSMFPLLNLFCGV